MPKTSSFEWSIGLYRYVGAVPHMSRFASAYALFRQISEWLGVAITHMGATQNGRSSKLVESRSAAARRILDSQFAGATLLSCLACEEGVDFPMYDRLLSLGICWTNPNELRMGVSASATLAEFCGPRFEEVLSACLASEEWEFGYAFSDLAERLPELFLLGASSGVLSKPEELALQQWYSASPRERLRKLRRVFPVNVLGETHLRATVGDITLADHIERCQGTTVSRIGNLVVWRVPETHVAAQQELLSAAGVTIT